MMLIRKAHRQDVDAILTIERSSFDHNAFSRRAVSYHIENNLVLCAETHRLIGYICFSPITKNRRRRIYSIAVDPMARKSGAGIALMIEGEKKSRAKEIYLEVDETNIPAIKLYEKLGYTVFGRYENYYGATNALRMKKVLK